VEIGTVEGAATMAALETEGTSIRRKIVIRCIFGMNGTVLAKWRWTKVSRVEEKKIREMK
jgi:hypothetical protein